MSPLLITGEAIALAVLLVVVLSAVGLGPTLLLLDADGYEVLMAPAVGLALTMLAIQWISWLMPPALAVIAAVAVLGSVTVVVAFRRRSTLTRRWRDTVGAFGSGLLFFAALSQIVAQRGALTIGSFPADNVFIYAQAAQYLRNHSVPLGPSSVAFSNPGSYYLITVGHSFPSSVGSLDAAASVLTGLPVHELFDPITGLGLAVVAGPLWYFVRANLGGSWWTAAAAAALLGSNQLLYWVVGLGLQQECLALAIFTAGLSAVPLALSAGHRRAAALVGILASALVGVYLPMAALLVLCALGGVAALLLSKGLRVRLVGGAGVPALAAGAIGAIPALSVLVFAGGLSVWASSIGARVAAGAVSKFPPLLYVVGALPFAHVWELSPQPLGRLETTLWPGIVIGSLALIALAVLGSVLSIIRGRTVATGLMAAAVAFAVYELVLAQYPYGFVKSVGYISPLVAAFAAYGATGWNGLGRAQFARPMRLIGAIALGVALLASLNGTRDMLRLWISSPPAFTAEDGQIAGIDSIIPAGAHVLIDDQTTDYGTLVQVAAVAYFLPDRNVRVFVGDTRMGTFEHQDVMPAECAFDYVIGTAIPPVGFTTVEREPITGLFIFKRVGSPCSA